MIPSTAAHHLREQMPEFVHLHCHTQYSLLDGASDIAKMMDKAVADGQKGVALTDHGNMFGAFKFVAEANKRDIKPIVGCEFYLVEDRHRKSFSRARGERDKRYHQLLLAKNQKGYENLSKLCSLGFIEGLYTKFPRIDKELLVQYHEGLIATSCCIGAEIPQAIIEGKLDKAETLIKWWLDLLGEDFYIEIQRHRGLDNLNLGRDRNGKTILSGISQEDVNQQLLKYADKYNIKVIATNDAHYVEEEDWQPHDILLCVNTGSLLNEQNRFKFASSDFYFKTQQEMRTLFKDRPDSIDNTMEIFSKIEPLELARDVLLPAYPLPQGINTQDEYLRHLTYEGAKRRYGDITPQVRERLDFELEVIRKSGYPGYFLIVQDFTTVAREMGVSVGPGRGSAAGSAVAYCIGITNVDPIKYDLLFERFLNPERVSMPDIDIDFDDVGRQKVIDYVIDKYGQNQVAQIITYGAMKAKSAIKDVGRVMDIPLQEVVAVTKSFPDNLSASLAGVLADGDIAPKLKTKLNSDEKEQAYRFREMAAKSDHIGEMIRTAQRLEGSIRNTGIHACGVVITPDDITKYVPVKTDKNSDMLVSQFDNSVAEDAGLLKMDFLGLKTLSIIRDAVRLVKEGKDIDLEPDDFPLDDEQTYQLFQRGETVAIFQYESAGMQKYMKELVPTTFEDLIAMNALYRPGPLEYIPDFIERKHGRQQIRYDLPAMEEYLHETYGICVTGDTLVYDAKTGQQTRIDELEHEVGRFEVQGVDENLKAASAIVTHWVCNGEKAVFQVELRNGSKTRMTANHRVLTPNGWRALGKLKPGDYIATPRRLFAKAERLCSFKQLSAATDQTVQNHSIPKFVFGLKPELIAKFVIDIWEMNGVAEETWYHFTTKNARLATDLQTLLLRLGVRSSIKTQNLKSPSEKTKYQVRLSTDDFIALQNGRAIESSITAPDSYETEAVVTSSVAQSAYSYRHYRDASNTFLSKYPVDSVVSQQPTDGVCWEQIDEIVPVGMEVVYDITVENIHNFVGNNIILHNCVYQEQVMLLSQKLANFSKGEADMLRKAMGKKKKKLIDQMHPKFIAGGEANGHPADVLNKVWKDWEAFASYAFNKSHSTCYAFIAFQTAYLKAHHPAEFMASVLTHNKTDISKLTFFLRECKRMGLTVLGPHINESQSDFSVNKDGYIRFGMSGLKGLGEGPVEAILKEREKGDFINVFDMMRRADLRSVNKKAMEALALGGGFDCFDNIHRAQYFAASDKYTSFLEHLLRYGNAYQMQKAQAMNSLFGASEDAMIPEPSVPQQEEWSLIEKLNREREVTGIYISGHPLDDYRIEVENFVTCALDEIDRYQGRENIKVAGIVLSAQHRISKKGTGFGICTLQDYNGILEFPLFGDDYVKFKEYMEEGQVLFARGNYEARWNGAGFQFKPKEIKLLESVGTAMTESITLKIPIERVTDDFINSIDNVCRQYQGQHRLRMKLVDRTNGLSLTFKSNTKHVDVNNDFVVALDKMGVEYKLN